MEMRKMPGIKGEVLEQPARRRASTYRLAHVLAARNQRGGRKDLQSRITATAIRTMRTWW